MRRFRIAFQLLMFASCWMTVAVHAAEKTNVLFIAIDDLRPTLGCYGDSVAVTPNIDKLAGRGTVFRRAYCQQAVCSPSRWSLLTGRRPDTIRVWDLKTHPRQTLPDLVTLPQHFKQNGYHTQSVGKVLHGSGAPSKDAPSWSVDPHYDYVRDPKLRYALPKNLKGKGLKRAASESAEVDDDHYIDGIVCNDAIETLKRLSKKTTEKPFFLGVGFRKPHLPFCAPKKYWDLYHRKAFDLTSLGHPSGAPELATRSWKELEGYNDIPKDGRISEDKARQLRHGYYACVSYVDALVGRLLNELTTLGLDRTTAIVLWGDHGFHLGEQGIWAKANNYELSTRVPLIVASPNRLSTKPGAIFTDAIVELVDVFPTLVDLCGLDAPSGLEGLSMRPLLDDLDLSWKRAAFSQYPRAFESNRHQNHGDIMGYAVRTRDFRFVQWREWESRKVVAEELYDHRNDADEMRNVAMKDEYADTVAELAELLVKGWQAAAPDTEQ